MNPRIQSTEASAKAGVRLAKNVNVKAESWLSNFIIWNIETSPDMNPTPPRMGMSVQEDEGLGGLVIAGPRLRNPRAQEVNQSASNARRRQCTAWSRGAHECT